MLTFFCDFDGTISKQDVIDTLLENYASRQWLEIEKLWNEGKITTRECLDAQMALITITEKELDDFLSKIEIDESFLMFVDFVKSNYNSKVYILSDGFKLFIEKILKPYGVLSNIDGIYANNVKLINNKFQTFYNHSKHDCQLGVCKCSLVQSLKNSKSIYIGDGRSDFCVSQTTDFVFAKGKLFDFLKENKFKHFTKFSTFKDVINKIPYIKEILYEERRNLGSRAGSMFMG
ncbi:MAG TPA: 2,3-diketo-5-methylthio-1-phosphopentane phosphatase [Sulfurihydrogenibium sp.]|uniref:MtnX-like HAD-IB family phosphatase n=1 Tax=Sulfurihydrogenibium sp. (strain YO3AOP1) TaxID=436114 RepID=UPI00017230AA|nr:MtnX-like HAD-IB family phosphatase [Sulfurihydrogenibium sp. YO3AOP1]ACD65993.1 2,3-diketo-5-methylthio-1-phosphopentane phosphatase [Sulfurihydrogenibium sp. YO3AOP1]HBT98333.1 2,3-diketo-5-methylthio-1-phosphopentane phosphatase [Sulfurihydrogenibium sp.]